MNRHLSHISKEDLEKEFYRNVQDRHIDQKFSYLDKDSVEEYYQTTCQHTGKKRINATENSYYTVLKKHVERKNKIALISLGCGNAGIEKHAIEKLLKEGYNIMYVGVDTSLEMLKLAEKNLSDVEIDKIFLHMDMVDVSFKNEIDKITKGCGKKIFGFLGGTLGNVNQTNIADSMYNTLEEGDLLWIDVRIQPNPTMEENMKLFGHYTKYLDDGTEVRWFSPLKNIGVPFNAGKMNLKMIQEQSVGALLFVFYFTFNKKIIVKIGGKKIHFLPNEEIKLQNIRVYHPETLIKFFKEHEFKFINMVRRINKGGQFIFKR